MVQIATVAAITGAGSAFAVNEQGVSRQLKAGDTLQKGETIRTVGDVRVELLMDDGRLLAVAPGQVMRLDENVTESDQRPTAQDSAVTTPGATAETVIQALERGVDLSTQLEATAAGLGGGAGADGGISFVQLLRITEGVDPLAYEYSYTAPDVPPDLESNPQTLTTTTMVLTADPVVLEGSPGVTYTVTLGDPTTSDMTVTLSNGAVIVIPAGSTTGSVLVPVQGDDVYKDGETLQANIDTVQGGDFTSITVDDATVITVVNDTIDTTPVSVGVSVLDGDVNNVIEGTDVTFRFSVNQAPQTDLILNVTIGGVAQTVTIAAGSLFTDVTVDSRADENYLQGSATVTGVVNSVSLTADGNFENLSIEGANATATIVDDGDATPVTLTGPDVVAEGAPVTYTATLLNAAQGEVTVTLSNGATITIANNAFTGTVTISTEGFEGAALPTVTIVSATGGNFERLVPQGAVNTDIDSVPTVNVLGVEGAIAAVNEGGLEGGNLGGSITSSGTFPIDTGSDTLASLVVGDVNVTNGGTVTGTNGTLVVTNTNGNYSWTYTLTSPTTDGTGIETDSFSVLVTDTDGDTANANLVVAINDDTPLAANNVGGTVTEDGATTAVSGNVLGDDAAGADTPKVFDSWSTSDTTAIAALNTYGTLVQGSDGAWSYTLDNTRPATQALGADFNTTYTLNYTMKDADGDPSSAQLTITVKGALDSASVVTASAQGADATVYEAGLVSGDSESTSGTSFTVSATDGISNIVVGGTTVTAAELNALSTTNKVIQTGEGTLTLTNYNSGTGAVSYTYTLNATIDNDSKVPATGDAVSLTDFTDNVTLTVNGLGGTTASDTLSILVVDDVPVAVNEPAVTLTESHVADTDWFTGSVKVLPGDGFKYITDINGVSSGDSLKITWVKAESGSLSDIAWQLRDAFNTVVASGTGSDGSMTAALTLASSGNYKLYVDDTGSKEINVTDVHQLHTVTATDSGNVMVGDPGADTVGADGAAVYSITYVNTSGATVTEALGGDGVADVVTKYGTLHIEADGDYTYIVKQDAVPLSDVDGQVEDNLSYTLMDGDGDTASANMNYVINDIKPPSVLDVTMLTNTNNQVQPVILTFVDQAHPEYAYARLFALNAQGQQGTFTPDTGFNIANNNDYVVGLEAASSSKVNLTDLTIEGVPIFGQATGVGGGVTALELNDTADGSDQTGLVAVIHPNTPPAEQSITASTDGDGTGTAMTVTTPTVVNYLYGAGGDDALNGNSGTDILNGGTGIDSVDGAGGNDMLVYDHLDGVLDGGTGDDVLRIDDGALALFNTVGLNQAIVDLTGNTAIKNVEVLLLTDDAQGAADKGTTLVLRAEDVLHFTDSDHVLTIVGNNSDKLDLSDDTTATWAQTGTSGDGNFAIWTATFADTSTVTLKVETEVSVLLNNP